MPLFFAITSWLTLIGLCLYWVRKSLVLTGRYHCLSITYEELRGHYNHLVERHEKEICARIAQLEKDKLTYAAMRKAHNKDKCWLEHKICDERRLAQSEVSRRNEVQSQLAKAAGEIYQLNNKIKELENKQTKGESQC